MATFSTYKTSLDEIAGRIQQNRKRLQTAKDNASTAKTDLDAMPTAYSTIISKIDTFLTNNPDDPAAKNLKAEKDLLVSEFNALSTTATNMKNAVDGITI